MIFTKKMASCWKHASGATIAAGGLRRIAHLCKIEASIRGHGPEERLATRQAQSAPMIADFRLWLTHQRSRISTKSRLGEKRAYIHRHGDGLQVALTDGRVEMDRNPVESIIRPITLTRKNALFALSQDVGFAKSPAEQRVMMKGATLGLGWLA